MTGVVVFIAGIVAGVVLTVFVACLYAGRG